MATTWYEACVPQEPEPQPQPSIMERLKLIENSLMSMSDELRHQRELVEELYRRIG